MKQKNVQEIKSQEFLNEFKKISPISIGPSKMKMLLKDIGVEYKKKKDNNYYIGIITNIKGDISL